MIDPSDMNKLAFEQSAFFSNLAGFDEGDLGDFYPADLRAPMGDVDSDAHENPAVSPGSVWARKPKLDPNQTARGKGGKKLTGIFNSKDVEELQKALNAIAKPQKALVVDGDMSAAGSTVSVLKTFQAENDLEPNGIADAKVWDKLAEKMTPEAAQKLGPDAAAAAVEKAPASKKAERKKKFAALLKKGADFIKEHPDEVMAAGTSLLGTRLMGGGAGQQQDTDNGNEDDDKGWGPLQWGLLAGGVVALGVGGFFLIRALRAPAK